MSFDLPDPRAKGRPEYAGAIPLVVEHLFRDHNDTARCVIASARLVERAELRAAWPALVEAFRRTPEGRGLDRPGAPGEVPLHAGVRRAQLLETTCTPTRLDDVIALVRDLGQGAARTVLLRIPPRSRNPKAAATIDEMSDDPVLATEIAHFAAKRRRRPGPGGT